MYRTVVDMRLVQACESETQSKKHDLSSGRGKITVDSVAVDRKRRMIQLNSKVDGWTTAPVSAKLLCIQTRV